MSTCFNTIVYSTTVRVVKTSERMQKDKRTNPLLTAVSMFPTGATDKKSTMIHPHHRSRSVLSRLGRFGERGVAGRPRGRSSHPRGRGEGGRAVRRASQALQLQVGPVPRGCGGARSGAVQGRTSEKGESMGSGIQRMFFVGGWTLIPTVPQRKCCSFSG